MKVDYWPYIVLAALAAIYLYAFKVNSPLASS